MNRIEQTVIWRRLDMPGLDACYHGPAGKGWRICGTSLFFVDGRPCHIGYAIDADAQWRARSAHVFGTCGTELVDAFIAPAPGGAWTVNGARQEATHGCIDLDLAFTPAARLLTLRRLALVDGQHAAVDVARFAVPGLALRRVRDDYVRLNTSDFRLASSEVQLASVVSVDEHMALLRHPGHWERHTGAHVRLLTATDPGPAHGRDRHGAGSGAVDEMQSTGS
jgi:hypothetical protein